MFQKEYKSGALTVNAVEQAGDITVKAELAQSIGGGKAEGILKARFSAEVDFEGKQLVDLGLDYIATKYPALAGGISFLKGQIDALIEKA